MSNITIYDIAKKCGVSPSTVSKVVNNYATIPQETKDRILKTMKDMNYIPNIGAKSLTKNVSRNIGVIAYFGNNITPFKSPLFVDILDSAQTDLNAQGYDLLFISHNVDGKYGTFFENCVSRNVAGAILFGDTNNKEVREVAESSIPCVAFDYADGNVTGVFSNNEAAAKQLTNHLISLGHNRIMFIHGEPNQVTNDRIKGFQTALKEANIPFDNDLLVPGHYLGKESIVDVIGKIVGCVNRPTAILFPDDVTAIKALSVIEGMGLRCPEDISIAGFDGIEAGQLVSPHLTTIKQDSTTIGKLLAKELIDLIEKRKSSAEIITARSTIIIGESTGPVRK